MVSDQNNSMYSALQELCANNEEYFKKDEDENGQRLCLGFRALSDHVKAIMPILDEFRADVNIYDFDSNVPGNGYRSFIIVTDTFVILCVKICKEVCIHRGTLFFKKSRYVKDVEISGQVFASLISCFELLKLMKRSTHQTASLFLREAEKIKESLKYVDRVNLYCFYGRFSGFQFAESIQPLIKTVSIMMATFAAIYFGDSNILSLTSNCSTVLMDPEARASQIVKIATYRNSSVHFCKAFWNLSEIELFKMVPNILRSNIVNELYTIAYKPLQCVRQDGSVIEIPIPKSHISNDSVSVRLISAKKREGMAIDNAKKEQFEPPSRYLIFHCHGGGFVAQTSGSHFGYLKDWSSWIDAPIISVDYSLAPEAPYPRALEEVLYAYGWVLNNASTLGTTAEKIIFAGDSAGGNLCLSLALKCIDMNLRLPDGIFLAYVPVMMSVTSSPARLLCLLDPLMPFGFMLSCVKAYTYLMNETAIKSADGTDQGSGQVPRFEEDTLFLEEEIEKVALENEITEDAENSVEADDKTAEEVSASEEDSTTLPSKFRKITQNFIKSVQYRMNNLKNAKNIIRRDEMVFTDNVYHDKTVEQLIDEVPEDMYLSPYLAGDEMLKQLPPVSLVSVQLDPCLDDCVMLAKKLKTLNNKVSFTILEGLPHGFLNLSVANKEAQEASKLCAEKIKGLFEGSL